MAELPEGFSWADVKPKGSVLPEGFTWAEERPKPQPQAVPRAAPVETEEQLTADPFERAAMRTRRSVQPPGGRREGLLTQVPEQVAGAVGGELERMGEQAEGLMTGRINPQQNLGSVYEMALMGLSPPAGVPPALARTAAQQVGVTVPRAAEASPIMQSIARGISRVPVLGRPLQEASERASRELVEAGTRAAARPTGRAVPLEEAGAAVRGAIAPMVAGERAALAAEKAAAKAPKEPAFTMQDWIATKEAEDVARTARGAVPRVDPKVAALLKGSDESIVHRIASMAGSTRTADIGTLMKVKETAGEAWPQLQSSITTILGRDPRTAEFSGDAFIRGYGNLSQAGRRALFGEGGLSRHLDSLLEASRRAPTWEQFGGRPSTLGTSLGVAAMALSPMNILSAAVPGASLAKYLARPASAASIARFARTYEAVQRSGGAPAALGSMKMAVENLKNNIEELDTDALLEALPKITLEL